MTKPLGQQSVPCSRCGASVEVVVTTTGPVTHATFRCACGEEFECESEFLGEVDIDDLDHIANRWEDQLAMTQPSETEELEAALWALTVGDWSVERASLYDEEGVEGWRWDGPRSVDGHAEVGDWYDLPPVPDVVVDAYREWKASR